MYEKEMTIILKNKTKIMGEPIPTGGMRHTTIQQARFVIRCKWVNQFKRICGIAVDTKSPNRLYCDAHSKEAQAKKRAEWKERNKSRYSGKLIEIE